MAGSSYCSIGERAGGRGGGGGGLGVAVSADGRQHRQLQTAPLA